MKYIYVDSVLYIRHAEMPSVANSTVGATFISASSSQLDLTYTTLFPVCLMQGIPLVLRRVMEIIDCAIPTHVIDIVSQA